MKKVFNLNYYKNHYMDLFLPDQEEFFVIIHFHGGGLVEGDKGDTHQFSEHLANAGFAVGTANYSLYPNTKFPECLYDAANAVKYLMDEAPKYGKVKGYIISGQSAGAWITLMLCFNKEYLSSVGVLRENIVGFISDAAQTTSHFNILKIEQGINPWVQRIDETAPIYYVKEDVNFSHILLMCYEQDLPSRVEQNKLLVSTIKNFNKEADVELKVLKGYHCRGSSELDEDGEYETIKVIKEWVKRL